MVVWPQHRATLASHESDHRANRDVHTRFVNFYACTMQALAHEVACYLGLELGGIKIKRFADGEIYVQVQVCLSALCTFLAVLCHMGVSIQ